MKASMVPTSTATCVLNPSSYENAMHVQSKSPLRTTGLLVSAALSLTSLSAADTDKTPEDKDALPTFENYLQISTQGNWSSGDKAAFQAESATTKKGFGGVEDFQFSKDLKNDFALKTDGHALIGNADYLAHVNVSKNELGAVDIGYKRFRTYYDNAGGFFLPTENSWLPVFNQEMFVDRAKLWAETKLTLPNLPVITLRYTNETRTGTKDSTIWGASDFTGMSVPSNGNANQVSRFISPTYLDLDERHQKLELLAKHTLGKTSIELSVAGDRVNNVDTFYFNRYPGQVKYPLIATTPVTTVDPSAIWRFNNQITGYNRLQNDVDTLTAFLKVETAISNTLRVHAGLSYQRLSSDVNQFRPLFTATPYPSAAPIGYVIAPSAQALGLVGGASGTTYTANVGADLKVGRNLTIETGIKAEDYYIKASDAYQTVTASVSSSGVITQTIANIAGGSRTKEKSITPEIGARYTGIKNISLFGTAEYKKLTGKERVITQYNYVTASQNPINDDVGENHGRYTIGANWVPCNFFTLRGETFYKDHRNNFEGGTASAASSKFVLGYKMKGGKITATVKPIPTVSLTSRYVYQTGEMETSTGPATDYQSMDAKIHQFGETIDWTPIKQFYVQGNLNVVFDTTSTSYPRAGVTTTSSGNDAIHNADNNYWNASVLAGVVVDKDTNAEIQYTHYKADNYEAAFINSSLPYGTSQTDYTLTVGVKRKLSDTVIAEAKVGVMDSKSDTTGGRTNYKAYIGYVSLIQAF